MNSATTPMTSHNTEGPIWMGGCSRRQACEPRHFKQFFANAWRVRWSDLERLPTRGVVLGCTMLLRLKPGHACDVISVVTELMVDVARVEARPCV
jgi:hypothetical protein